MRKTEIKVFVTFKSLARVPIGIPNHHVDLSVDIDTVDLLDLDLYVL